MGRDDHRGVGRALSHGLVNRIAIVGAIRSHSGDRVRDLVEQGTDQGGIAVLGGRQLRSEDLAAVGIDRQVQLASGPARLTAMLLWSQLPAPTTFRPVLSITT